MTAPQAQHGNAVAALQKFKVALQAMEEGLSGIPMGTPLHSKALTIIKDLHKALEEVHSDPSLQIQQLLQMARTQGQQSPIAALSRMYPAAQGGGTPGASAATPPAGGAAPSPTALAA